MKKNDQTVQLFDLPIFSKDKNSLLKDIWSHLLHSRTTAYIFTPNPEQIVIASQQPAFQSLLKSGDWLVPDGIGLVIAARLLAWVGKCAPLQSRIPGVELTQDLLALAEEQHLKVLVVGGREYQLSNLDMVHTWHWLPGYAVVSQPQPTEEATLTHMIEKLKPDLVFVAFGAPAQEEWVAAHRSLLESAGVKLVMVVGGSFDVILGKLNRAPAWMNQAGLEWLYRLIQEPWRWRRQLRLITFGWLTLKAMIKF